MEEEREQKNINGWKKEGGKEGRVGIKNRWSKLRRIRNRRGNS